MKTKHPVAKGNEYGSYHHSISHNWCDLLFLQNKEGCTLPTTNVPISLKTYRNVWNVKRHNFDNRDATSERPISNHVRHFSITPWATALGPCEENSNHAAKKAKYDVASRPLQSSTMASLYTEQLMARDFQRASHSTLVDLRVKIHYAVKGIAFDFYKFPKAHGPAGLHVCGQPHSVTKDQQPKLINGTMQHAFLLDSWFHLRKRDTQREKTWDSQWKPGP